MNKIVNQNNIMQEQMIGVLTFLGESFAGSGLFMLPLVEEASLVEAFVDLFLFVIVTSTSTCEKVS
jgi:hypothetical protein